MFIVSLVNDQRVGAAFRAVRLRRGWRQVDVARRAKVGQTTVHEIEHGRLADVSTRALRAVAEALEIRLDLRLYTSHGELERLLNAGHSALHETIAAYLGEVGGWQFASEVSFAIYRERGIIDILAFHEASGCLLVIELKTELVSLEDLLGTMDVRMRLARAIARERGWHSKSVSSWVVFAPSEVTRRRVADRRNILRTAFPEDGRAMRAWLKKPEGQIRALSFWSNFASSDPNVAATVRRRVRKRESVRAA